MGFALVNPRPALRILTAFVRIVIGRGHR